MATITCHDCGAVRHRTPANTLYCVHCRLLRNIEYWVGRTRRCRECDELFAPVDRTDVLCSDCNPGHRGWLGTCKMCGTSECRLIAKGVAVCTSCARDPDERVKLAQGLRKGQAARREANNHLEAP